MTLAFVADRQVDAVLRTGVASRGCTFIDVALCLIREVPAVIVPIAEESDIDALETVVTGEETVLTRAGGG